MKDVFIFLVLWVSWPVSDERKINNGVTLILRLNKPGEKIRI